MQNLAAAGLWMLMVMLPGCLLNQAKLDEWAGEDGTNSGAGEGDGDGDSDGGSGGGLTDADGDGVAAEDDCDDEDDRLGSQTTDADCDGVPASDDCDDTDSALGAAASDIDCDGTGTADDCDDEDPSSTIRADDMDCDGHPSTVDCDDSDAESTVVATDADCDGALTENDCDDSNAAAYPGAASLEATLCTTDRDGDGYGDAAATVPVEAGSDCNDDDHNTYPGASEGLLAPDHNCDGQRGGSALAADFVLQGDYGTGVYVGNLGDMDGDGADDLLFGSTYSDVGGVPDTGLIYLMFSSRLGADREMDLDAASEYRIVGAESDGIGNKRQVATGGDVDGDGLGEVLFGAGGNETSANPNGFHYLFMGASLGATSELAAEEADFAFEGEAYGDNASFGDAFVGDVDGDGRTDFVVGAPANDLGGTTAGKVYLLMANELGSPGTRDLSTTARQIVGHAELMLGAVNAGGDDIDGDGLDDLLVGADNAYNNTPAPTSLVLLFYGGTLSAVGYYASDDADLIFEEESPDDNLGSSLDSAGDIDGDGYGDIAISAHRYDSSAGAVYLFSGSSIGSGAISATADADLKLVGAIPGESIGYSAEGVVDIEGDGLTDLMVSSSADGGKVFGFLSSDLAGPGTYVAGPLASFVLTGGGGSFGFDLAGGDFNGDGRGDLAVGALFLGRGYVILGEP